MKGDVTVSGEQVQEVLKAVSGIAELVKKLQSHPEHAGILYGIMVNVMTIRSQLGGIPRVTLN